MYEYDFVSKGEYWNAEQQEQIFITHNTNEVVHLKIVGGINNRFECLSHENVISVLVLITQVHSVNNTQQVLDDLRAWHQKHSIKKKENGSCALQKRKDWHEHAQP